MSEYTVQESSILRRAAKILATKLKTSPIFTSPERVKDFVRLSYAGKHREEFGVLYLDAQYRLIEFKIEFVGTITQTSVYPREIVKTAIGLNASACILVHNHPSGNNEPSRADELLTSTLKSTLALIDVRVLDHLIVGDTVQSFAEKGLL